MRFLIYEYLTGGGLWHECAEQPACASLLAEGQAMRDALVQDLLAWHPENAPQLASHHTQVVTFQDARWNDRLPGPVKVIRIRSGLEELEQLASWCSQVDGVVLIAPEFNRRLLDRCELVERHRGVLYSPDSAFVELTGDKHCAIRRLERHQVPVPVGRLLQGPASLPSDFDYPAVLKPVDGAGGLGTRVVHSAGPGQDGQLEGDGRYRLESYCVGEPVSVAALCGPQGHLLLAPCRQHVSNEGVFKYLGGRLPLEPKKAARARRLADLTLDALPRTRGYVGVDMILGREPSGCEDIVLEVNPRLTTSYIGLCRASRSNLAASMIGWAKGQSVPAPLCSRDLEIQFDVQGRVVTHEKNSSS